MANGQQLFMISTNARGRQKTDALRVHNQHHYLDRHQYFSKDVTHLTFSLTKTRGACTPGAIYCYE